MNTTPQAGLRASVNLILSAAVVLQLLLRRQLRLAAPGRLVLTCLLPWLERLVFTSPLTATSTRWAVAPRTLQGLTSSTPLSTRLVPTAGCRNLRHSLTTK